MLKSNFRWAQERNFSKYRLMGAISTIISLSNSSVLTPQEQDLLDSTLESLFRVKVHWNKNNSKSKDLWSKS